MDDFKEDREKSKGKEVDDEFEDMDMDIDEFDDLELEMDDWRWQRGKRGGRDDCD